MRPPLLMQPLSASPSMVRIQRQGGSGSQDRFGCPPVNLKVWTDCHRGNPLCTQAQITERTSARQRRPAAKVLPL